MKSASFLALGFILGSSLYASMPSTLNYQGRVLQNGQPFDGTGHFVFGIYEGSTLLWTNKLPVPSPLNDPAAVIDSSDAKALAVRNGVFTVRLGEGDANNAPVGTDVFFKFDGTQRVRTDVKLKVWFSPAAEGPYTRLDPDISFASVPFAQVAGVVEAVKDGAVTTRSLAPSGLDPATNLQLSSGYLAEQAVQTGDISDAAVSLEKLGMPVARALVPAGTILPFAGVTPPEGYLLCDGASYPRTGDKAVLFSVIGTSFGAQDGGSFNVPDLRGQFLRGSMPNLQVAINGTPQSNVLTTVGHPFNRTGMRVRVQNPVTGLVAGQSYFIIRINEDQIAFASSHSNAISGFSLGISGTASNMIVSQFEDPDTTLRSRMAPGATALGAQVGTIQADEIISHHHDFDRRILTEQPANSYANISGGGGHLGPNKTNPTGGNETRPRNVSVNYIIKY